MKHFMLIGWVFFATIFNCYSQKQSFEIHGKVINEEGPLVNALINVYTTDSLVETDRTNSKGQFNLNLPLGENYFIEFEKLKHYSKWVAYETEGVNPSIVHPGFKFKQWEVYLIKEDDKLDEMEKTIKSGRVYFDEETSVFDWDINGAYFPKELLLAAKSDKKIKNNIREERNYLASNEINYSKSNPTNNQVGTVKMISEEVFPQFTRQVYLLEIKDQDVAFSKVNHQWGSTY